MAKTQRPRLRPTGGRFTEQFVVLEENPVAVRIRQLVPGPNRQAETLREILRAGLPIVEKRRRLEREAYLASEVGAEVPSDA